jgi:hypothetical protein
MTPCPDTGGELRQRTCTSPQAIMAMSHKAEMLDVEDPSLGYDADTFP